MYSTIDAEIWRDQKIRAVIEDGRSLFYYLLTCPHRNIIGFYRLPPTYAMDDLQWNEKRYKIALNALTEAGLIFYDEAESVVLIKNFLKWNRVKSRSQIEGAANKVRMLPQTKLMIDFKKSVERFVKSDKMGIDTLNSLFEPIEQGIDRVSIGYRGGIDRGSTITVTETESVNSKQKTVTETEDNTTQSKRSPDGDAPQKNDGGVAMSKPDTETALSIVSEYNEMLGHIKPKPDIEITPILLCRINRLVSEYKIEKVLHGLKKVVDSDWLVSSNFICLDWIVHPENFFKILSGKYDNKKNKAKTRYEQQMEELNRGIEEEKARMEGEHSNEQAGNTGTFENNNFDIPKS